MRSYGSYGARRLRYRRIRSKRTPFAPIRSAMSVPPENQIDPQDHEEASHGGSEDPRGSHGGRRSFFPTRPSYLDFPIEQTTAKCEKAKIKSKNPVYQPLAFSRTKAQANGSVTSSSLPSTHTLSNSQFPQGQKKGAMGAREVRQRKERATF